MITARRQLSLLEPRLTVFHRGDQVRIRPVSPVHLYLLAEDYNTVFVRLAAVPF